VFTQPKVLAQEADEFRRGAIVGEQRGVLPLCLQHRIEQDAAAPMALVALMDVKVKHAQGLHFDKCTCARSDEQFLRPDLQNANDNIAARRAAAAAHGGGATSRASPRSRGGSGHGSGLGDHIQSLVRDVDQLLNGGQGLA
jgi:hypothetical protein